MHPRGIIKDEWYYVAGLARYNSGSAAIVNYRIGIFVNRHNPDGTWEKGTPLPVPSTLGVTEEFFNPVGIEKLSNGDIVLYGSAEKSGRTVAFVCAVNISSTNAASWSVRWARTFEIVGQNTRFLGHFIDGTNIIIHGDSDASSIALKIPRATTGTPSVSLLAFGNSTAVTAGLPMADNSGYVFVGANFNGPRGGEDLWIAKTNVGMNSVIWQFNYGGSGDDYAEAIMETSDGFLVAGATTSPSITGQTRKGTEDIYILKVNKDGTLDP
jgi:hypothetical protein